MVRGAVLSLLSLLAPHIPRVERCDECFHAVLTFTEPGEPTTPWASGWVRTERGGYRHASCAWNRESRRRFALLAVGLPQSEYDDDDAAVHPDEYD